MDKIKIKDIDVVVQGAINENTPETLASIRKYLPEARIILSSWKGSDTKKLDCDLLLLNDDPGAPEVIFNKHPVKSVNLNRQIISTLNGLKAAERKYALKIRSDFFLQSADFLEYFYRFPIRNAEFKTLKERVIVPIHHCVDQDGVNSIPFHISDWFHFGLTEDLLKIWDVPLIKEPEMSAWFQNNPHHKNVKKFALVKNWSHRYTPEQCLMLSFLKKYHDIKCEYSYDLQDNNKEKSKIILANNFIVLNLDQIALFSPKYQDLEKRTMTTYYNYNHNSWLALYNKYCGGKEKINIANLLNRKIMQLYLSYLYIWKPNYIKPFKKLLKKPFKN